MCPTNTLHKTPKASPSDRSWQTGIHQSSAHWTMSFKNEVASDEDIDRYNLPFPKGGGRWWTRDAERDYYLWGGLSGNLAFDDMQEGWFSLYADGMTYSVTIMPGTSSQSLKESPFIITWKKILQITPEIEPPGHREYIIQILKEALTAYGYDGENNSWPKDKRVVFELN